MDDISAVNESDVEKQCLVCNDLSSGRHYGAFTCEGCKGFFRRIICYNNQNLYSCIGSEVKNECEITNDSSRRKCCKSCRFQKCLRIGMKPELCIKIERKNRFSNYVDSVDSNDEELESEQIFVDLKDEIEDSFNNYLNFVEFDSIISGHSFPANDLNFLLFLNRLRLSLESNVRQFMSFITILRELNVDIQKELMYSALNEILILKMCFDFDRCGHFLIHEKYYFGNKEIDALIRSLLDQLMEWVTDDHMYPALYVLTFFNSIMITKNERIYIQKNKLKILKAFNLDDEIRSAKISQILQHLSQISVLLKKWALL